MKPSNFKMPTPSSDETLSANTFNSFVDTTTAGIMTDISLTPRASLESNSTITPPSQHSKDAVGNGKQRSRQHSNHHHHHGHHSPPCSPLRSPPREHNQSSFDQQPQQEDQQKVQDQITEPGQDPEQQEQSQPQQQQQPHKQHQRSTSPSSSPSSSAEANHNNKGKTALNEFITRSRSSTLYTPSDNERDEQIRIAILMRCLDMEERFQVQTARYWGRLQ